MSRSCPCPCPAPAPCRACFRRSVLPIAEVRRPDTAAETPPTVEPPRSSPERGTLYRGLQLPTAERYYPSLSWNSFCAPAPDVVGHTNPSRLLGGPVLQTSGNHGVQKFWTPTLHPPPTSTLTHISEPGLTFQQVSPARGTFSHRRRSVHALRS